MKEELKQFIVAFCTGKVRSLSQTSRKHKRGLVTTPNGTVSVYFGKQDIKVGDTVDIAVDKWKENGKPRKGIKGYRVEQ